MSKVAIRSILVMDNPAFFRAPLRFEITYECTEDLEDDIVWELNYDCAGKTAGKYRLLNMVHTRRVSAGPHLFIFEADAPDASTMCREEIVGRFYLMMTCSYRGQIFTSIAYSGYINYIEESDRKNPPSLPILPKLQRIVYGYKPFFKHNDINWHQPLDAMDSEYSNKLQQQQTWNEDEKNAKREESKENENGSRFD